MRDEECFGKDGESLLGLQPERESVLFQCVARGKCSSFLRCHLGRIYSGILAHTSICDEFGVTCLVVLLDRNRTMKLTETFVNAL